MLPFLAALFGEGAAASSALGAAEAAGAAGTAATAASPSVWSNILSYGKDAMGLSGGATPQAGNMADNLAAGANNSGWGSLISDVKAGNYASAAGNVINMGEKQGSQPQQMMQPEQQGPVTQPSAPPVPGIAAPTTPFLQQMMNKYARY